MFTLDQLLVKKGHIATLSTVRDMKVKKNQLPIQKHSTFQARFGIDYNNIKAVKIARENGSLPTESKGLPWGVWEIFPFVISHKDQYYIRCYTVNNKFKSVTKYIRDDIEISAVEAKLACYASEFPKSKSERIVFNIKVETIVKFK